MLKHKVSRPKEGPYKDIDITSFTLKAGSKVKFNNMELVLVVDTEVSVEGVFSYDAIVENIYASGNAGVNAENCSFKYVNDEGVKVAVRYGGRGQRIETPVEVKPAPEPEADPKPAAPAPKVAPDVKTTPTPKPAAKPEVKKPEPDKKGK